MDNLPLSTATLLTNKRFLSRKTMASKPLSTPARSSSFSTTDNKSVTTNNKQLLNKEPSRLAQHSLSRSNSQDKRASNNVFIQTTPRRSSIARESIASGSLPAYLMYLTESGSEQRFDLIKAAYSLGRMENRDIVLQCPQISKDHCGLEFIGNIWIIRDHGSANGVLINREKIPRHGSYILEDGDFIQLGSVLLQFFDQKMVTPDNWRKSMSMHPAFASQLDDASDADSFTVQDDQLQAPTVTDNILASYRASFHRQSQFSSLSRPSSGNKSRPISVVKNHNLVTVLPSEQKYDQSLTVRAEINGENMDDDFKKASDIDDPETLKQDYEKLRLAYELSKVSLTDLNLNDLLQRTLDITFSVLAVDRGVIMLVDRKTSILTIDKVKLREGSSLERKEILLSSTVLQKVVKTKKCIITSDAFEDPLLGKAESIARNMMRSVICVPLIAHNVVHGILHLDSKNRLNAFAEKDLSLVKSIANQAAIALENCRLIKDIEKEVTIRENLGRFLPPHVIDKVIATGQEPFKRGGRQTSGTILFADIRGFTNMSESSSPQEIVDLLNDFFERLVQIVFKYDGVLDKYIGDCLMAAFGTLPDQVDAEFKAVCAALEFKEAITEMNVERQALGKQPITVGIGINTGTLVAGYIGSSQRLEYTSIGDTVNTASRICSLAHSNQLLVSEDTHSLVESRVKSKFSVSTVFKGKTKQVSVFEIEAINVESLQVPDDVLRKLSE